MPEPFTEQKWPDAQGGAASGVEFGRLKGRKYAGLGQGVDPNRVELRQVLRQPPHPSSDAGNLLARGHPQTFQHGNQFRRRQFAHEFIRGRPSNQSRRHTQVIAAVVEVIEVGVP